MTAGSARYDEFADFYESFAPDVYEDPATAALLNLLPEVAGLRLLDLACGHGRIARELARRGAAVMGIDISSALIEKARTLEQSRPMGITYLHADAADTESLHGEKFDGIACGFAMSDIDDLDGVLATVARVLSPGGFFVFSMLHPCFPGWDSRHAAPSWAPRRGYYEEGWWLAEGPPDKLRPKVGANHRMMSTYLNALARHGFAVEQASEPDPGADWMSDPPIFGPVPVYLALRCRRSTV